MYICIYVCMYVCVLCTYVHICACVYATVATILHVHALVYVFGRCVRFSNHRFAYLTADACVNLFHICVLDLIHICIYILMNKSCEKQRTERLAVPCMHIWSRIIIHNIMIAHTRALAQKTCAHVHTHTHTHIYIYIYIRLRACMQLMPTCLMYTY